MWDEEEGLKVSISIEDAIEKHGIRWETICEETGYDLYALAEGLGEDTMIDVPIDLLDRSLL